MKSLTVVPAPRKRDDIATGDVSTRRVARPRPTGARAGVRHTQVPYAREIPECVPK